jgi:hypothetical protein
MAKVVPPKEQMKDMTFPVAGIDVSMAFVQQRPQTTPSGLNVRAYEPGTNRARGGQRSGLSKFVGAQPNGLNLIQQLFTLVGVGYPPPGGSTQTSSSGRVVTLVAVSGGNVYALNPGNTSWTAAINATGNATPLVTSGLVRSDANNQKLWFADGMNYCVYDPSVNTVSTWTPDSGTLPDDSNNNTPRLICTWRGRTVLSGIVGDPQNWFMSAISDPQNFNYFPTPTVSSQAVAGNNSNLGLIGDVVTSLVPYSDDVLIFGGDHTIYMLNGDPMNGGQLDLVSDAIGFAWGIPWCKDPYGNLYFVSNRTGIYQLNPTEGTAPQRISQAIEELLVPIDTGANTIRLIWDDRFQGLHVFITPTGVIEATTHYFYEQRSNAWWQDQFANVNMNPQTVCVFDGNLPGDRRPLIGSWDGYVRFIDPSNSTDDGTAIDSSVMIGPLLTANMDEIILKDLQCLLGANSGQVSYKVFVGSTPEIALASTPVSTGTWSAGRNPLSFIRRAGHAVYVEITSTNAWAMEAIRTRFALGGKVRQRYNR